MPTRRLTVAFDIGASAVKAGIVDPATGDFVKYVEHIEIDASKPENFAEAIPETIRSLTTELKSFALIGLGLSMCALCKDGVVVEAPNLQWFGVPLVDMVRGSLRKASLNMPVAMENDGDCFTLGEWRYGVAKGHHDVLGVTLGTGIGGGFVVKGRIFRGGMGYSIEPGHTKVNYTLDTPICGCGARFCLEAGTGAAGIIHTYKLKGGEVDEKTTVEDIFHRAEAGEDIAQKLFIRIGRRLGVGLAGLCNIFNPQALVIGGGVSRARKYLEPSLRSTLEGETLVSIRGKSVLLWSELMNRANLLGAAAMLEEGGWRARARS
jgi:glucokinase